jgi:hypothetical protein
MQMAMQATMSKEWQLVADKGSAAAPEEKEAGISVSKLPGLRVYLKIRSIGQDRRNHASKMLYLCCLLYCHGLLLGV